MYKRLYIQAHHSSHRDHEWMVIAKEMNTDFVSLLAAVLESHVCSYISFLLFVWLHKQKLAYFVQVEGLGVICRSIGMAFPPINPQVELNLPTKQIQNWCRNWRRKNIETKKNFTVCCFNSGERVISSNDCKDRQQRRLHKVIDHTKKDCFSFKQSYVT